MLLFSEGPFNSKPTLIALVIMNLWAPPAFAQSKLAGGTTQQSAAFPEQNKCDAVSKTPNICYIRKGTKVQLSVDNVVTTENRAAKIGDTFSVSTTSPVTIDNHVVIPAGTKAVGQVDYVAYKGAWGRKASLSVRLLYLDFSGHRIRLASTLFTKGKGGAWAIIPLSAVGVVLTGGAMLPVSGQLSTGKSAKLKKGEIMSATIDEDVPVDMSDFHKK